MTLSLVRSAGMHWKKAPNARCPDCGYYIAPLERPTPTSEWHCYNCARDIDNEEFEPIMQTQIDNRPPLFDYSLDDLQFWIIKRKSGETVKYTLTPDSSIPGTKIVGKGSTSVVGAGAGAGAYHHTQSSYSEWCNHDPATLPTWASDGVELYIADAPGVRKCKEDFDIVIDCGDVITDYFANRKVGIVSGAERFVKSLAKYSTAVDAGPEVIKLAWADRKAPALHPAFWPDLASQLQSSTPTPTKVVINCVGGHGRSGTALVCLMLVLNPDYSAADAIIHLRAIHCARAIESGEQHEYINLVAKYLDRPADATTVHNITSFKEAFKKLTHPSSVPYQARLSKGDKV